MKALKDMAKLFLVMAGVIVAGYLIVKFWWIFLFILAFVTVLLVIGYIVDGRFRQ